MPDSPPNLIEQIKPVVIRMLELQMQAKLMKDILKGKISFVVDCPHCGEEIEIKLGDHPRAHYIAKDTSINPVSK